MSEEKKGQDKKVNKEKRKNLRIPPHLIDELDKIAEKHHRSFNSELIVAVETYVDNWNKDWKNKH
jgi:Arc-like DNA binding domain.